MNFFFFLWRTELAPQGHRVLIAYNFLQLFQIIILVRQQSISLTSASIQSKPLILRDSASPKAQNAVKWLKTKITQSSLNTAIFSTANRHSKIVYCAYLNWQLLSQKLKRDISSVCFIPREVKAGFQKRPRRWAPARWVFSFHLQVVSLSLVYIQHCRLLYEVVNLCFSLLLRSLAAADGLMFMAS